MKKKTIFPCTIMRGGTSKGIFLMEEDLPQDPHLRDRIILEIFGSPDIRQIDGLGGADSLTSKLALIAPSKEPDRDVNYTFGAVEIDKAFVDYSANCGNISSAVGPYAIAQRLVKAEEPFTTVRIFNINTQKMIHARVPIKRGKVVSEGDYAIDGVPGTGAKIELSFSEVGDQKVANLPEGKIVLKDRIADAMFQQILLRPEDYDVLAMPNLNGDHMSDALAAQVGGLGMAPGANIGDQAAVFEATHGTAPKYANQDMVNPGSLILSGAMTFDYLGWSEAGKRIVKALEKTISEKIVTYDLARQMRGANKVKCSEFASAIIENL